MAGIYESDPGAAPDSDLGAGELAHLVAGNRGRLLDARRTPVEDVGRFQFARGSRRAPDAVVAALAEAARRFDRPGDVACEPAARAGMDREFARAPRDPGRGPLVPDRAGRAPADDLPRDRGDEPRVQGGRGDPARRPANRAF